LECSFQNCDLVWNAQKQGSKLNSTLQFWQLNVMHVNTQHHVALCTFTCYPGLFFVEHTTLYSFAIFEASDHYYGLWVSRWNGLVFPVGWFEVKEPLHPPVNLCITGAQGQDCILSVHCLSLSLSHCFMGLYLHHQVSFLFKGIRKMSCTQNTTARDLCSRHYMPARI